MLALPLARRRPVAACLILIGFGILKQGIADLPWPFVLTSVALLGQLAGGRRLAALLPALLVLVLLSGLWPQAMLSLYLAGAGVLVSAAVGGVIGLACVAFPTLWRIVLPLCDLIQTIPMFVFLIPVLMIFQIGEFSAFLAICLYSTVPMIRYTRHGLASTPEEMLEAALTCGATPWAIFTEIRMPQAVPSLLLGLNQTILSAFSMLVIAALIGTTELGQVIYAALGQGDVGLGLTAGAAMVILALCADRILQGFAARSTATLGV